MARPQRRQRPTRSQLLPAGDRSRDDGADSGDAESLGHRSVLETRQLAILCLWVVLTLVWAILLFRQEFFSDVERWALFLVPDQLLSAWIDGPISIAGVVDRCSILVTVALVLGVAGGSGHVLIRGTHLQRELCGVELWVFKVMLGLIPQSSAALVLGLLHLISGRASFLLMVGASLVCAWGFNRLLRLGANAADTEATVTESCEQANSNAGSRVARCLAVGLAMVLIAHAILPPSEYDVR